MSQGDADGVGQCGVVQAHRIDEIGQFDPG